jgi:hypothetical protein
MRKSRLLLGGVVTAVTIAATAVTFAVANAASSSYEAEASANTLAGGAKVSTCSPCSGGKKVGFVGNGGTLQFNGVSASAAGSVTVTISYASGAARSAQLSVNGGTAKTLNFASTGSYTTVGTLATTVTLKSGSNTLKFSNSSGWAPDFDKIVVGDTGGGGGGGAPTAAQLLAKVSSCNQISNGKYKTDEDVSSATVAVCGATGAVFWKSDMDIDCDGQRTTQCNENTDCCFQNDTAFHQSDGKPLNSAVLPYIVVPSTSNIWNYSSSGVHGASVAAVIYNGQLSYAVVGDTGPSKIIGEGSYSLAVALGIDPDPSTGGTDAGVTFIVFTGSGSVVSPIESHSAAVSLGEQLATQFVNNN